MKVELGASPMREDRENAEADAILRIEAEQNYGNLTLGEVERFVRSHGLFSLKNLPGLDTPAALFREAGIQIYMRKAVGA